MRYTHRDKTGHERGEMGPGKPKGKRIYSVRHIAGGIAHVESESAWGRVYQETLPANTIEPLEKEITQ